MRASILVVDDARAMSRCCFASAFAARYARAPVSCTLPDQASKHCSNPIAGSRCTGAARSVRRVRIWTSKSERVADGHRHLIFTSRLPNVALATNDSSVLTRAVGRGSANDGSRCVSLSAVGSVEVSFLIPKRAPDFGRGNRSSCRTGDVRE